MGSEAAPGRPALIGKLLDRLTVDPVDGEPDCFGASRHVRKAAHRGRVFGGQLAAQALLAAQATVDPAKQAVAIHVDYVAWGDPDQPIRYRVERTGGDRTEVRRVEARQGEVTAVASVRFQPPGEGFSHQHEPPEVARPGELPPDERMDGRGFRVRMEPGNAPFDRSARPDVFRIWWSTDGPLADDPPLHQALLLYMSDISLPAGPFRPLEGVAFDMPDAVISATLGFSAWFHRPFRADEWLLHDQSAPSAHGGRGFAMSHWWTEEGELVATCAQQTVSRLR